MVELDKERGVGRRGVIQAWEGGTTHPWAFMNIVTFLDIRTASSTEENLGTKMKRAQYRIKRIAQCIALCRASTLAEKLTIFSPYQRPSPAKTRTSSRPAHAHNPHLRPSANGYQLSERR